MYIFKRFAIYVFFFFEQSVRRSSVTVDYWGSPNFLSAVPLALHQLMIHNSLWLENSGSVPKTSRHQCQEHQKTPDNITERVHFIAI